MRDTPTAAQTRRRYALFQVPGLLILVGVVVGLYRWAMLPGWGAVALVAVWILKDAALYPWLRTAYEPDSRRVIERLIGLAGVAVEPLAPRGYVRVRGELWQAEPAEPDSTIDAGRAVTVHAIATDILLVRPLPDSPSSAPDAY
ncbi:MAG: NfeD family protein [Vicinamibacterales bacterium]|nr:NfeD family protein [Vicinamibacterales bacterium]